MMVRAELDKLCILYGNIDLGEIEIKQVLSQEELTFLGAALLRSGLELMDNKKAILIERIKNVVIELVHYTADFPSIRKSDYISQKLQYDYTYLANIFSESLGMTIEHFIILHKIERVKELLMYDEKSLTEIAFMLNYSSVSHLSSQFKKVTGLTPTFFKNMRYKKRINLEDV
ncbi:helix-turn-helix domain-containing protein [Sphingobacterium lumbrici]|uniref:helix-turn-helix domain-containing protein n=1 Tax=Sphingobacterium lumbrici TaxID=2559600 RepID=UPI001C108348|nr:helix-turn-helix domain-containing protein [Sphingobacterium lumbrici]